MMKWTLELLNYTLSNIFMHKRDDKPFTIKNQILIDVLKGEIDMIEQIKRKLKAFPTLYKVAKLCLELKYYIYNYLLCMRVIFPIEKWIRMNGFGNIYIPLKKFKNIHLNERCFIIATGPSLRIEDLNKLKDELTFSMNSIVLSFGKTDWRPTYYAIFDRDIYKKFIDAVIDSKMKNVFLGNNLFRYVKKRKNFNKYFFPLYMFNHENALPPNKYYTKFSDDIYSVVYDSGTILYCVLQIAIYMGFKEIYLVGADCNYYGDVKHFIEYPLGDKEEKVTDIDELQKNAEQKKKQADNRYYRMITGYKEAKKYADSNGIKIFNATRGGMLEVFDRVNLDEVI